MKRNKMNKDIKTTKKPVKKTLDTKAIAKDISARGKKMYLSSRKTVSALKKLTKSVGKLITEANQTGNQKLANHITKLFGYLGFNTDSDANKVSWSYDAKVKPLKAPKKKEEKKEEQKTEKRAKRQKKVKAEKKPDAEANETESADAEPTDEEIAAAEEDDESSNEVLAGDANDLANVEETGAVDESDDECTDEDEDDEEEHDDYDDDDCEPESYEDGLAAYRREAWGNGDFERDDI